MASEELPAGLSAAASTGNRLTTLRVLRDRLAVDIDVCTSARDVASLSQRLMDVLAQIADAEKAEPEKVGTPLDELAKRRTTAGRPNAAGATRASRTADRS